MFRTDWSIRGTTPILAVPVATTIDADPLAPILPGGPRLVRRLIRGADPGPGGWLGGHQRRAAHADPCADGERANPGRLPVVPGPTGPATRAPPPSRGQTGHVRVLEHLAAQGPHLRRGAQPAGAADGHRPGGAATRRGAASDHGRQPDRGIRQQRNVDRSRRTPPDILITTPGIAVSHAHEPGA